MYVGKNSRKFKKWFEPLVIAFGLLSWLVDSVKLLVEPFPIPVLGVLCLSLVWFGLEKKKPKQLD